MPEDKNKDASLKRQVTEFVQRCGLEDLIIDREVHINFTGAKAESGEFEDEKETDVVARFSYAGKIVLLLFECEDSIGPSGSIRAEYRDYEGVITKILGGLNQIEVLHSRDDVLRGKDFKDVDEIRLCFVYGSRYPEKNLNTSIRFAKQHGFAVWGHSALRYFLAISSTVGKWAKYELFRELNLNLEQQSTSKISALEIKQKGQKMYLGAIHPGLLLKIAYVTRRARESTYAYQRMLNKHRIKEIAAFISSSSPESFLANAVIIVFDAEPSVQRSFHYDSDKQLLTIPRKYCSAWIIDGQHRVYGFLDTKFEEWTEEKFQRFDLPVVIFRNLEEISQTRTFITINYNQKKIKPGLLCDLATVTGDMTQRLTWASLVGKQLNANEKSPLYRMVKVSELDFGRPISLSSLVQYGLLETLLGFKAGPSYNGPLARHAPIDASASANGPDNRNAREKQVKLLMRFLSAVKKNTKNSDSEKDPWTNTREYSLLKPTGVNALFMVLARIMKRYPSVGLNLEAYLAPIQFISFGKEDVARMGGGWSGFRELANVILRKLNAKHEDELVLYVRKEKI